MQHINQETKFNFEDSVTDNHIDNTQNTSVDKGELEHIYIGILTKDLFL